MYNYGQKVEVVSGFYTGLKGKITGTIQEWWFKREYRVEFDNPIKGTDGYQEYTRWFKEQQLKRRTRNG